MNQDTFTDAMSIADELLNCDACGEASTSQQSCPQGFMSYAIRQGESLITLARSLDITLAQLLQYNPHINPYFYKTGEVLCVPIRETLCPGGQLYTVQEGDTLASIARTYGLSTNDLITANPYIVPEDLMIGQLICLPVVPTPAQEVPSAFPMPRRRGGSDYRRVPPTEGIAPKPVRTPAPVAPTPAIEMPAPITCPCRGADTYCLREGESYTDVLERFCLSLNMLRDANPDVDLENLPAQAQLRIPDGRVSCEARRYTFVRGDTPLSVARAHGITLGELFTANPDLSPCDCHPGKIISIP